METQHNLDDQEERVRRVALARQGYWRACWPPADSAQNPLGSGFSDLSVQPFSFDTGSYQRQLAWLTRMNPEQRFFRGRSYEIAKRTMDLSLIFLCVPLLLPVGLLCFAAVKVGSPDGPVVFVQQRTGRGGHRFRMYKFRTMVPDAEKLKRELAYLNRLQWPDFKVDNDPRMTRVGRILRRLSLDELPQIINVMKGEMSLVGPRPTSFGPDTYTPWQKRRLEAAPGLTGLWQIVGRGEMEFDQRVRLDLAYIERAGLSVDVKIILRTFGAILGYKGPY